MRFPKKKIMDAWFSMLLILCAVAGANAGFSDASVEEVQKYLKDWDLHEFLGDGVCCICCGS